MTKQDLLDLLAQKFTKVLTEKQVGEPEEGITHWAVPVFDKKEDVLIRQWIHFYTDEEDNAYWQDREPKVVPVESFTTKLQRYLNFKIADGTLEAASLEFVDAINLTAIVKVWIDQSGIKTARFLVDKDDQDIFQYRIISPDQVVTGTTLITKKFKSKKLNIGLA